MNAYLYWQQERRSPGCNNRDTLRRDLAGFYRIAAAATKPEYPLAIWEDQGKLVAKIGHMEKLLQEATEPWHEFFASTWIKAHAVSEAAYRKALETGWWWRDILVNGRIANTVKDRHARQMDDAERLGINAPAPARVREEPKSEPARPVDEQRSDAGADIKTVHTDIRSGAAPGPGHNLPADPFEALKLELDDELQIGRELYQKPIETAEQADQVAVQAKKLAAIKNRADTMRETEKAPHLKASRDVDDKFRDTIQSADRAAGALKKHSEPWFAKLRADEEARQKAARAEADRLRREAEEAAEEAKAAAAAPGIDTKDAEEMQAAAKEAQEKARIAEADTVARKPSTGRTGAKLSERVSVKAKITDWAKAIDTFKNAPELRDVVQKLADRAVGNGQTLPGFVADQQTKVV